MEVAARGPAPPRGHEERVFEKFHRAAPDGLGLDTCRGLVQAHSRRIWAPNLREGGVAVLFTVPLPDTPPAPGPPDA